MVTPVTGTIPIVDGIDFGLTPGRRISGTVTDADGGVGSLQVNVSGTDVNYWDNTTTGPDGTYTVAGLPNGHYRVTVETSGTDYARQSRDADVSGSDATGVNFALLPGARLRGLTYDDGNHNGTYDAGEECANVQVQVYDWTTGEGVASGTSGAEGSYEVSGLPAGTFRLQSEPDARNYVRLYDNNTPDYDEATSVDVAEGETLEHLDFRLIKGQAISGLAFFDANGNGAHDTGEPGLANLWINADRTDGQYSLGTSTAGDGTYILHGLLPGTYRVYAWAQGTPYATEYFKMVGDLAVGTYDQNDADLVGVTSVDASGIDFSLNLGGGVTGIVRADDETPIAGAYVNLNPFAGSGFGYGTQTGSDGRYLITGLPPGQYRAYASDSQGLFVGEYDIDKLFYDDANPLAVSARATVDDPLAAVADFSLGPAVAIEGVVYNDANGNGTRDGGEAGIGGVRIQVNDFTSTNHGIRGATTAADGTYHVGGLPAETDLRVQAQAWPTDFISVWYDGGNDLGTTNMAAAEPVNVPPGPLPTVVNFALIAGGAIAGTVVDGNGDPLPNMYVNASGLAPTPGGSGDSTSSTGQFVLHALVAGTYRVTAGDSSSAYGVEVYDNQRDNNAATPVGVAAGLTTSGINFVLPSQPTIVSVSPTDDIQRGDEATIQVTGTRLAGGDCSTTSVPCARVEVGGGGVTIVSSSLDEGTGTFSVGIRLASDAPLGGRSVSIVNDFPLEDAAAVMANALTVVPRETGDTPATSAEYAYLVDGGLSEVEVYQTADNSFVRTIPVAGQPSAVTLSPDGHFLYTSSGDRVIGVVDTRLGKEVARIPVDGNQGFNAIAATSRFVFVVDRRLNDRVRVIDTKSWTVVTEIVLGPNAIPYAVETDPLGRWVYAAILNPPHVAVFDADPQAGSLPSIVSTVSLPPSSSPRGMAFTPDGSRAYVVSSTNTYVIDTALAAVPETPETVGQALIDTDGDSSNGKATPLPTRGGGTGLIEIAPFPGSPGTLLAYIPVNNNRIWVVDVSTDRPRIVRDVVAGYLPRMIRATSDGARVFVSHVGSLDYYVLDAANLLLSQPQIPVSLTRFAASVAPAGALAVGPIPPAPPSTAPVVASVTLPGGSPARNGAPFTIEVTGDHFGANPIVWLQDTNVHGTVTGASSTSLTVELPFTTQAGDHVVVVSNPLDGGNESGIAPTTFAVRPPESFAPTQSVLSVSYVKASLTVLAPDGSTDVIPTQAFTNGLSLTPDGRLAVLTSFSSGPQTSGDVLPDWYCDASIIDLDPASTTFGQTVSKVPVAFGYFSNPAVTPNADNPNGVFVYVPDYQMDLITVIDPATQAEVDIDNDPATQSIQPDDENWWPLSEQLAARLQGINRIELRDNPTMGVMITTDVGITPDGSLLYVTNQGYPGDGYYPEFPAQVTIVDTVTRQVVGALQKGGNGDISQATAVAITPSRPGLLPQDVYVYVVGLDATASPALFVYRANELHDETAFVARVPVPETTRGIVVSPDGHTVYLTARYAGDILAINVTPVAGGIDGTLHTVHAQTGVMELVVAPDDGLLYVAQGFTTALFVYDIVADPMTPAFVTSLGVPESPVALAVLPTLLRPRIGVVSPTNGDPTGGTPVVLTGANFAPGATVTFGGVQATGVTVVNAYLITAVAPAGAGVVDIKVTNPDGQYRRALRALHLSGRRDPAGVHDAALRAEPDAGRHDRGGDHPVAHRRAVHVGRGLRGGRAVAAGERRLAPHDASRDAAGPAARRELPDARDVGRCRRQRGLVAGVAGHRVVPHPDPARSDAAGHYRRPRGLDDHDRRDGHVDDRRARDDRGLVRRQGPRDDGAKRGGLQGRPRSDPHGSGVEHDLPVLRRVHRRQRQRADDLGGGHVPHRGDAARVRVAPVGVLPVERPRHHHVDDEQPLDEFRELRRLVDQRADRRRHRPRHGPHRLPDEPAARHAVRLPGRVDRLERQHRAHGRPVPIGPDDDDGYHAPGRADEGGRGHPRGRHAADDRGALDGLHYAAGTRHDAARDHGARDRRPARLRSRAGDGGHRRSCELPGSLRDRDPRPDGLRCGLHAVAQPDADRARRGDDLSPRRRPDRPEGQRDHGLRTALRHAGGPGHHAAGRDRSRRVVGDRDVGRRVVGHQRTRLHHGRLRPPGRTARRASRRAWPGDDTRSQSDRPRRRHRVRCRRHQP